MDCIRFQMRFYPTLHANIGTIFLTFHLGQDQRLIKSIYSQSQQGAQHELTRTYYARSDCETVRLTAQNMCCIRCSRVYGLPGH
jgi:uncharacterized paraquat-inducible protein A